MHTCTAELILLFLPRSAHFAAHSLALQDSAARRGLAPRPTCCDRLAQSRCSWCRAQRWHRCDLAPCHSRRCEQRRRRPAQLARPRSIAIATAHRPTLLGRLLTRRLVRGMSHLHLRARRREGCHRLSTDRCRCPAALRFVLPAPRRLTEAYSSGWAMTRSSSSSRCSTRWAEFGIARLTSQFFGSRGKPRTAPVRHADTAHAPVAPVSMAPASVAPAQPPSGSQLTSYPPASQTSCAASDFALFIVEDRATWFDRPNSYPPALAGRSDQMWSGSAMQRGNEKTVIGCISASCRASLTA